ncbi:MAG: glycosyltransferase family 4 protein [Fimbriimonadaceae bacterium]
MPANTIRIAQVVSSSATSGAERHVFALAHHLTQRGNHVEVLSPGGGWLTQDLQNEGIAAHTSDMKGVGWFRTVGTLMNLIKEQRLDVIHSHLTRASYFGYVAGALRRVPVVATVHIANHDWIYKRMARGNNRLVAVSNFVRGMLHGRGIKDKHIDTVYNGTDFAEFAASPPEPVLDEFQIPRERRLVGLVGRVAKEKGHLLMIEAMKPILEQHPDAHFMFVGRVEKQFEPELQEAIETQAVPGRLTMTGNRTDVPRLIDSFALSTMPSSIETFGMAAVEAMARGKAVVASRVGGLPEVVRHGQTGLLVDLRSEGLADAVSYLLSHEEECERMGVTARRLVEEKFTLGAMVSRLEDVYRRALS